uniref:Lipase_3 domain-containing protein n=1 Tax=Caenorhabditis tropicalis TaxID=1561998 RepID=A0A1I7UCX4_9PELO
MRSLTLCISLVILTCIQARVIVDPVAFATYDDNVARNSFFPLAAAAYSSNPQTCLSAKFTNAQIRRQINVQCDTGKNDICSAYTALLADNKAVVLSFRGAQGFLQLIEEADKSVFQAQSQWVAGGKVSKYFGDAFNTLWNAGMKDDVNYLLHKYPTYEVWVTGHSLGGAMASLAASYIVSNKIATGDKVKLVTYGQPRTGNTAFAVAHDAQMAYSYRLTHNRDIVPHIPNEGFEDYKHHKSEVFYKESMNAGASYKVCSSADESNDCSNGLLITASVFDHLTYFTKDVSQWGEAGCN